MRVYPALVLCLRPLGATQTRGCARGTQGHPQQWAVPEGPRGHPQQWAGGKLCHCATQSITEASWTSAGLDRSGSDLFRSINKIPVNCTTDDGLTRNLPPNVERVFHAFCLTVVFRFSPESIEAHGELTEPVYPCPFNLLVRRGGKKASRLQTNLQNHPFASICSFISHIFHISPLSLSNWHPFICMIFAKHPVRRVSA